jgi:hypothetical protein
VKKYNDLKFFCRIEGIEEKILDKCNSLEKLPRTELERRRKIGDMFLCTIFRMVLFL